MLEYKDMESFNKDTKEPEFDIFSIPDDEITPDNAFQMLGVAAQMAQSWGRDTGELQEILRLQQGILQNSANPVDAIKRVRGIFNTRQDYN